MTLKEARAVAEGIARELGYELVDVEFAKEPGGHFLRFYIDREEGIALDELESFHRRLLPLVETVDYDYMEGIIGKALAMAEEQHIRGKEITPFLLAHIKEMTGGESFASNVQLALNNARCAARIAVSLAKMQ